MHMLKWHDDIKIGKKGKKKVGVCLLFYLDKLIVIFIFIQIYVIFTIFVQLSYII